MWRDLFYQKFWNIFVPKHNQATKPEVKKKQLKRKTWMKSMKKGLIPLKCVRYWCGRFSLTWDNLCLTGKNSGIWENGMTLSPANLSASIDPPTWWSNLVFTRNPIGRNKYCLFKDELRCITKAQNMVSKNFSKLF